MTRTMLSWEVKETSSSDVRHLLYSLVVPRPIAWVSTVSKEGIANLAPHSFFSVVSSAPPIVMFASTHPHGADTGARKDTLRNIIETGEFVINLASSEMTAQMNLTSREVTADIDEFDLAGIEKQPSSSVRPCRVATAPAAMECRLHSTAEIGDATVVYGTVIHIHVAQDAMNDGRPDPRRLSPVARLGGSLYCELGEIFSMKRP